VYIQIPGKTQKQAEEGIMRKTFIVILGVLALAAVPLFGQWHSDFRVTNNPWGSQISGHGGWNIAADDADVHITWADYNNWPSYIRYFTFPIGSPAETSNGEPVRQPFPPPLPLHPGEERLLGLDNRSPRQPRVLPACARL
jgi:hypothetical protein